MKKSDQRQRFCLGISRLSVLFITVRLLLSLPLLLVLIPQAQSAGHSPRQQVLQLNSYRRGMTGVEDMERAVRHVLVSQQDSVELQIENMDSDRHFTSGSVNSPARYYTEKYRGRSFDLILATDNHAYDFLLANRDARFPGSMISVMHSLSARPASLPSNATVTNQPWSLYQAYRIQIWLAALFVLVLLVIIAILIFNIRSRIEAEARLRENKQWFEGIFNQTFQFIGLLSPDGRLLDANKSALRSSGADLDLIRGMNFSDTPWFNHSEDERQKVRAAITAAAQGRFVRFETTHRIADGRLGTMDFSVKPVFDERGEVFLLIPEGRDISELKVAQAALEKSRDRLEMLVADQQFVLDNINDFIYRHDLNGQFLYVSPSVKRITGFDPLEWSGNYADTLTSSPLNQFVKAYTDEAIRTGIAHEPYEIEIWHKSGRPVCLEISERPYRQSGEIVGMVGVARDVTDRVAAEKVVRDLNQFQQTIIDNVEVWLAVYDAQGDIAIWNKTAERISGYSREEVQSRRHLMTLLYPDPDYCNKIMASVLPAAAGNQPLENFHTRIVSKDGAMRSMVWNTRALSKTGDRPGSITIGLDITEREAAAHESMQLRNYLQNVVDSMPSILVAVDRECRIVQLNNSARDAIATGSNEVLGQPLETVFGRFSDDMADIRNAIATGRPSTALRRIRTTQAGEVHEDISVYPLVGRVSGAVVRVDDVTERMRIEALMIQSEKMLSVGGLAAGMAHEINNPLAGIIQNAQVMKNRFDVTLEVNRDTAAACQLPLDGLQEYLKRRGIHRMMDNISRSGWRAARIVDNMLSFSRKSSVEYKPLNLAQLVDATVELASNDFDLKKKYDFRRIEIKREYAADMPRVACERGQIQQVILNLLKNGAQAMSQSDPEIAHPCFTVRLSRRDGMAQIDVQDNGPGMKPEVLKRVFEPFYTTKQVGVGTGLGLSVSYFIVTENHKGSMKASSSPGQGACFSVQLPISRQAN